eukprot:g63785.t1
MSAFDYTLLGHSPTVVPVQQSVLYVKGLAGALLLGGAGWLASRLAGARTILQHSSQSLHAPFHMSFSKAQDTSFPPGAFVPTTGLESYLIRPGPAGPLQVFVPEVSRERNPHALFVYAPPYKDIPQTLLNSDSVVARLYGAKLPSSQHRWAVPTGLPDDLVQGYLSVFARDQLNEKLHLADEWYGFNASTPTKGVRRRLVAEVVLQDGSAATAHLYIKSQLCLSSAEALAEAKTAKDAMSVAGAFSHAELSRAVRSLVALASVDQAPDEAQEGHWRYYYDLLKESAHLSHKDWKQTQANALQLQAQVFPDHPDLIQDTHFRQIFRRALEGGAWETALASTHKSIQKFGASYRPWVVLVCGLNAIRKTTATYQDWFPELLSAAIQPPHGSNDRPSPADVPVGANSFFRQLDYVIAIAANQEFKRMYELLPCLEEELGNHQKEVDIYSTIKDSIFARYRTVAEMYGVLLVKECQKKKVNVMIETSGRDIGMYDYVNALFPDELGYRKLVLHFNINDLSFAQQSVTSRMAKEMELGRIALRSGDIQDVVKANMGGPYGAAVLPGVQKDEQAVWKQVLADAAQGKGPAVGWYQAAIDIKASSLSSGKPWTAQVGQSPLAHQAPPPSKTYNFVKKTGGPDLASKPVAE